MARNFRLYSPFFPFWGWGGVNSHLCPILLQERPLSPAVSCHFTGGYWKRCPKDEELEGTKAYLYLVIAIYKRPNPVCEQDNILHSCSSYNFTISVISYCLFSTISPSLPLLSLFRLCSHLLICPHSLLFLLPLLLFLLLHLLPVSSLLLSLSAHVLHRPRNEGFQPGPCPLNFPCLLTLPPSLLIPHT